MYEKMLGNCSSFPCLQSSVQRHPFQSTLAATLLEKSCFVADVGNRYLNLREQGVKRWTIALISLPSVFCYFFLIKTQPTWNERVCLRGFDVDSEQLLYSEGRENDLLLCKDLEQLFRRDHYLSLCQTGVFALVSGVNLSMIRFTGNSIFIFFEKVRFFFIFRRKLLLWIIYWWAEFRFVGLLGIIDSFSLGM